jgi:hypothetical protein
MNPVHSVPVSQQVMNSSYLSTGSEVNESIETIFMREYSQFASQADTYKNAISAMMSDPTSASNPLKVKILQEKLGDYQNDMQLYSSVARKVITCIDTLVRA